MRPVESLADHHTPAATTLHKKLLEIDFPSCQNLQFVISNDLFVNPSKGSNFFELFFFDDLSNPRRWPFGVTGNVRPNSNLEGNAVKPDLSIKIF